MNNPKQSPFNPANWQGELAAKLNSELSKVADELSAEMARAQDRLTREQFVEAMRQAILAGDFMRYVYGGEAQKVVYMPYQRYSEMEEKLSKANEMISKLKAAMDKLREAIKLFKSANREADVVERECRFLEAALKEQSTQS